jgi:uncharacterized FlaG/YvyC family protein
MKTMEIGSSPRTPQTSLPPQQRGDVSVQTQSVKTQLPQTQSVSSVPRAQETRTNDDNKTAQQQERTAALRSTVERNLTLDPRTREVIFQAISTKTGQVLVQTPDESSLRLREMYRKMRDSTGTEKSAEKSGSPTDSQISGRVA